MSSILEALKKLEDEKAAKKSGAGEIAGKVVKPKRREKQRPKWFYPAVMAMVAALSVLATYLIMAGSSHHKGVVEHSPARVNQAPPIPAAGTVIPRRPATVPQGRSTPPSETITQNAPATLPATPKPAARIPKPEQQPLPATQVNSGPEAKTDSKPHFPQLKITGIGWQKDSANRLAIVNGRPVSEGSTIDGAKVVEIFPDRVRFSFENQTIDITVGKSAGETP
jgi:general secretion pathway protein B